jgi:hypothetical protein
MTVCIAASSDCGNKDRNPKFIIVSDTLLSLGYTSTEIAFKARQLCAGWAIMFAGDDITHAMEVIHTAQVALREEKGTLSAAVVSDAVSGAYHLIRKKQIEDIYLKTYDLTMGQFMREGKGYFPEIFHLDLLNDIKRYDLGCQFLVTGFESERSLFPNFFIVENPGTVSAYDEFGYAAIGSGSVNALAHLSRRNQRENTCFEQTLYNVIAAKRLAEKASGVGAQFTLVMQERGMAAQMPDLSKVTAIADIWRKEEEQFAPPDLINRIAEIMK